MKHKSPRKGKHAQTNKDILPKKTTHSNVEKIKQILTVCKKELDLPKLNLNQRQDAATQDFEKKMELLASVENDMAIIDSKDDRPEFEQAYKEMKQFDRLQGEIRKTQKPVQQSPQLVRQIQEKNKRKF